MIQKKLRFTVVHQPEIYRFTNKRLLNLADTWRITS